LIDGGELIYYTKDIEYPWEGTYKGLAVEIPYTSGKLDSLT
tara:strand:- start:181 stop:303 length:123 start_codon:yes stop_codon:yes gene_type:complete